MSRTTKPVSGFYSDEAVRIVSDAARAPQQAAKPASAEPVAPPPRPPIAFDVLLDEPKRPPLTPEPAINQNDAVPRPQAYPPEPRRVSMGRVVAWVLLAPWYAAMLVGALGIDAMFVKDLLGL
ncbi:MAG: hypothetical protein ABI398_11440 [Devosia sp.]